MELFAALTCNLRILFRCVRVRRAGAVANLDNNGAANMLDNFSNMVDVAKAQAAVEADRKRELDAIGAGNLSLLNKTVASALVAGAAAAQVSVSEVDAFACGELEALAPLRGERAAKALYAASSLGLLPAVELLIRRVDASYFFLATSQATSQAAQQGHVEVLELLRDNGANLETPNVSSM